MFKKILSFALIVLLLNIGVSSAYAVGSKEEKEARFAEKVKAGIAKLGTGTEARVEVKLKNKTKLKGYVSEAGADSFTIVDEKTGAATEVPYSNAKQVKGNNLSKNVVLTLVLVGIFAVLLTFVALASGT
jgi:hypothetical protein